MISQEFLSFSYTCSEGGEETLKIFPSHSRDNFKGWGIHGKSSATASPHMDEFLPNIQLKFPLFRSEPIPPFLLLQFLTLSSSAASLEAPSRSQNPGIPPRPEAQEIRVAGGTRDIIITGDSRVK